MNRTARIILAVAAMLLVPSSAGAATVKLTAKNDGKTVDVYAGDQIQLKLKSCEASCGYHWATTRRPRSSIVTIGESTLSGQTRTFDYSVRKSGTTALELSYIPPGQTKAADTFSVRIVVHKSFKLRARDGRKKNLVYLASPGDRFVLDLPSCEGSCGYHWGTTVKPDSKVLRRTATHLDSDRNYRTFTYTAGRKGTTTLEMKYLPPGSKKPARTFRITVEVR